MEDKYISLTDFKKLLNELSETNEVFAPHQVGDHLYYQKVSKDSRGQIVLNAPRAQDSLKPLLFKSREKVSTYFSSEKELNLAAAQKIIVAAKACDLAAIAAQDKFFGTEPADPFYLWNRKNALLISSDCASAFDTCFCTLIKLQPYPKEGFDLNICQVEEGLVIEVGSKKGEDFIAQNAHYFGTASREAVEGMTAQRQKITKQVEEINKKYTLAGTAHEILRRTIEEESAWKYLVRSCTECAACNRACPTCSCFLLYDQKTETRNEKIRVWDHCLHRDYGRVAGGANPRAQLGARYQNRLQCKFDYMLEQIGTYSCTGCGRCIEVCMAKIDMRECLREMQGRAALSAKLE